MYVRGLGLGATILLTRVGKKKFAAKIRPPKCPYGHFSTFFLQGDDSPLIINDSFLYCKSFSAGHIWAIFSEIMDMV